LRLGGLAQRHRKNRHLRQEAEANRLAIELIAPVRLLRPFLFGIPDLASNC
jgi:hypothetical protein